MDNAVMMFVIHTDRARGALVSLAASLRLRGSQARWGAVSCRAEMDEGTSRRARVESHSREEKASLDCPLTKIPAQRGSTEATRIIHYLEWEHLARDLLREYLEERAEAEISGGPLFRS